MHAWVGMARLHQPQEWVSAGCLRLPWSSVIPTACHRPLSSQQVLCLTEAECRLVGARGRLGNTLLCPLLGLSLLKINASPPAPCLHFPLEKAIPSCTPGDFPCMYIHIHKYRIHTYIHTYPPTPHTACTNISCTHTHTTHIPHTWARVRTHAHIASRS